MKTLRLFISGNVQGVSYRNFVKDYADRFGVRGFARNLEDGRVEVLLEGVDDRVKEMVELCRKGPGNAKVTNVEVNEIQNQGFIGFKMHEF